MNQAAAVGTEPELPPFAIMPVRTPSDLAAAAALFRAYAASLSIDLAYQDLEAELAALPGKYAPPGGELLLARASSGRPLGCAALRPIEPSSCCEMKRLFVAPEGRGLGLGRALAQALIEAARRLGYREMRLDTLASMAEAQALYQKLGFEPMEPYYETPIAGTVFMRRRLQPLPASSPRP